MVTPKDQTTTPGIDPNSTKPSAPPMEPMNMTSMPNPGDTPTPTPGNSAQSDDDKDEKKKAAAQEKPKKKEEEEKDEKKDKNKDPMLEFTDDLKKLVKEGNEAMEGLAKGAGKGLLGGGEALMKVLKGGSEKGSAPSMSAQPDTDTSPVGTMDKTSPTANPASASSPTPSPSADPSVEEGISTVAKGL